MTAAPAKTVSTSQVRGAYRAFLLYSDSIRSALETAHPHLKFHVDPIVALNVTVAAYDDIDRYKAYHLRNHGMERSDVVKRATYFIKWITKFRPIMFSRPGPVSGKRDMALMANEALSVAWALELIGNEMGWEIKLSKKSLFDLLYDLHYREMGDGAILAIVQMITDLANSKKKNPVVEFSLA